MNSEKVKEIKKALENCQKNNCVDCPYFIDEKRCRANDLLLDTITLINEFESENERLENKNYQLEQDLGQCENGYKLELHTARCQLHSANEDLKKNQKRIAELEKVYDRQVRIINDLNIEVVKEQEKLPKFAERLKEKCKERYMLLHNHTCFGDIEFEINETLKEFIK